MHGSIAEILDDLADLGLEGGIGEEILQAGDGAVEADDEGADVFDGAVRIFGIGVVDGFGGVVGEEGVEVFGDDLELGGDGGEVVADVFGDEAGVAGDGGEDSGAVFGEEGTAGVVGGERDVGGAELLFSEGGVGGNGEVDDAVDLEGELNVEAAVGFLFEDDAFDLSDVDAVEVGFGADGDAVGVGGVDGDDIGAEGAPGGGFAEDEDAVHEEGEGQDEGGADEHVAGFFRHVDSPSDG